MKVQHPIGIVCQQHQLASKAFQLGQWAPSFKPLTHSLADHSHVMHSICRQLGFDAIHDFLNQVGIVAIEIFGSVQLEPTLRVVINALRQTNRIGHRHQHHLGQQTSFLLRTLQQRTQMVRHQHARQLLGVQTGLDVHLFQRIVGAVMQTHQRFGRSQTGRQQGMNTMAHGFNLCGGPSRPVRVFPVA